MRFLTRSLMGLLGVALTLALLVLAGWQIMSAVETRRAADAPPMMARERVFSADVLTVRLETLTPELTAFGQIESRRRLELRAAASGTVLDLAEAFEDGAAVRRGDLLMRIDPAEATAARDSQRAALAEAEAALAEARRALLIARDDLAAAVEQARLRDQAMARQQNLNTLGLGKAADTETAELAASAAAQAVLSRRSALSQAEAALDRAENTLEREKIALTEAERKLADTELRAEFDGQLSGVSAVRGGLVSTNEKLGELIDPAALEVAFRVSNAQYARLLDAKGALAPARAEVALDLGGTELVAAARLMRVGAAVGEGLTGRLLYAQIEAGAAGFRAGDFVTVRLAEPELAQVALLPATAVDAAGQVLVLGADDRLEEAAVEVLRRQVDDVIVRATALAGREIVAERTPLLGAGLKLRPLRGVQGGGGAIAAPAPDRIALSPERRAQLIAFVEANPNMPAEAKARILAQLAQDEVPAQVIERLEQRMGG
ncbi:efflux transporter periplasmic adaptor subunit [Rhodobacter veldkampii DSM 11550]|uniref:Efflux transporter periplasmic adaptor subunit n=1 Tax=Phaeovulum veldkampii DSM 11550 TaxID=1185920 RepID=A0A2T4JIT7_9RHOB|nr:HlyD family efflux transporter periplasmic adaptor subunit [Phaeovulum veldkampii]MBK5947520.1 efflux transporter periplasmic adaptor subunit [Phaeovulum veldkampii DSM 11550]PTE17819.1 efflux transporter periplasmic adaptor subunit [Phaeovulum veldkampii DSM 11550]TDQ63368.1 HlyD family secretion protein [Phaeovulum veldkampii DSM 11550]